MLAESQANQPILSELTNKIKHKRCWYLPCTKWIYLERYLKPAKCPEREGEQGATVTEDRQQREQMLALSQVGTIWILGKRNFDPDLKCLLLKVLARQVMEKSRVVAGQGREWTNKDWARATNPSKEEPLGKLLNLLATSSFSAAHQLNMTILWSYCDTQRCTSKKSSSGDVTKLCPQYLFIDAQDFHHVAKFKEIEVSSSVSALKSICVILSSCVLLFWNNVESWIIFPKKCCCCWQVPFSIHPCSPRHCGTSNLLFIVAVFTLLLLLSIIVNCYQLHVLSSIAIFDDVTCAGGWTRVLVR